MKPIAFHGTGIAWFPTPCFLVEDSDLFSNLKLRELRLYMAILCEAGKDKTLSAQITNKRAKELTGLDRWSLPQTRDALVTKNLITAVPQDKAKGVFRYTITGTNGDELRTRGAWRPGDADDNDVNNSWVGDGLTGGCKLENDLVFRPSKPSA